MKATLEFNLPEDNEDYDQYIIAPKLAMALWDITHNLKKRCEREANVVVSNSVDIYDGIDIVFKNIYEILEEYNINTDKIGII